MSVILYYSQFCQHSKDLLLKLSRTKQKTKIHFICIDQRERQANGETHIILENGSHLLLPDTIKEVPSISKPGEIIEMPWEKAEKEKKLVSKTSLSSYVENYYLSNSICRASKIMGKLAKVRNSINCKKVN